MRVDWSRFDETHGGDKRAAFEALAVQLFERFCRSEYGAALREVRSVDGRGGDGGVEAYAVLASGEEIGLQARWHREAFKSRQLVQIESSLRAAVENHPRLVRYVVASPRDLGDTRDNQERRRWDAWKEKAKQIAPKTEPTLWDDARIQALLSEHENEGLFKYWFTSSVITLNELERRFKAAKNGWLSLRYFPELHAPAALEQDLSLRLGERKARTELLREVGAAVDELSDVRFRVDQLQNYPDFVDGVADSRALREEGLGILDRLIDAGNALKEALSRGARLTASFPVGHGSESPVLGDLARALSTLDQKAWLRHAPTHDILEGLQRVLQGEDGPTQVLRERWEKWRASPRVAVYVGDPGVGKTHGLAHAIESHLGSGLPGLLLRARECKLDDGWSLEPDDRADGPPLLLAWALTSVDSRWRRRLRAELARWGSHRLNELVRWLALTLETNDPQMAEDIAMAAFGAACLAGADPRLGELSAWVDAHLLAPDAPRRREDIVVLHAARGIVERARVMGAAVTPAALEHAKRLYSTKPELLPIDAAAAKEADDRWGVLPLTWDLAFYVVPGAIQPFFNVQVPGGSRELDPRAQRLLVLHAEAIGLDGLTPQKLAFGAIIAHLRVMGWDQPLEDDMASAIAGRHERETHGRRSPVCTLAEKYVWTGCYALQAYLAGRVPARVHDAPSAYTSERWVEPPVDPVLVSDLIPNPASNASVHNAGAEVSWSFWADDGLVAPLDLKAQTQAGRADEWVRRAPRPDLRPWLHLPGHAAPSWCADKDQDWIVLFCEVMATERDSQAYSHLRVASFIVPEQAAAALVIDGRAWPTRRWRDLSEHTEGVRCHVYADPFDACWAPWATGVHGTEQIDTGNASGDPTRVDIQAASAAVAWDSEKGEATMRLPAHWLRAALGSLEPERRVSSGRAEWRFVDRCGEVHAVYTRAWATWDRSEAVLIRRSSLERALAGRGQVLAWAAWLFRQPHPHLFGEEPKDAPPLARRDWEWLAVLRQNGPDVFELPPFDAGGGPSRTPAPEAPPKRPRDSAAPPLVPVGPTNPGLATKLETELDDENAIPYFLWDDPMTVGELRQKLRTASPPERDRLLGKILREARDPDVWRFTSPGEVAARFDALSRHLGRRRAFWKFLLGAWEKEGLLVRKSA